MEDYAVPYFDVVTSDPSFEDMLEVVCVKKIRPPLPTRWHSNEVHYLNYKCKNNEINSHSFYKIRYQAID